MRFRTNDTPDHHIMTDSIDIEFREGYYETDSPDEIEILSGHPMIDLVLDFDAAAENVIENLPRMKKAELIAIAEFLGLEQGGTKQDLLDRIEDFFSQEGEDND